jgi:hypothetical protein
VICELAHIINPVCAEKRFMAVLTFKFDESYKDKRTLVVAGWFADDKQWRRLESRWQKAIAFENQSLPPEHRISRYHAAEMNAGQGPWKGWDTHRKNRLTRKLLGILSTGRMTAASVGINLGVFDEVFPRRNPPDYSVAYIMCMGTLLLSIADAAKKEPDDVRIALVHDHGPWDQYALASYNQWIDDDSWECRDRFVGIIPLTWKQDVGLQAADLIAYESMRAIDNQLWKPGAPMRYGLSSLIASRVPMFGVYHGKEGIEAMGKFYEEKYGNKPI